MQMSDYTDVITSVKKQKNQFNPVQFIYSIAKEVFCTKYQHSRQFATPIPF